MRQTISHYLLVLARQAERLGIDREEVLERAKIPPELLETEDQWIEVRHFSALMKALWRQSGDEVLGFENEPMPNGTWALVCDFMLGAETLGDMLRRGERILSYLPPTSFGIGFREQDDSASICIKYSGSQNDPDRFFSELWASIWHRFSSWVIDENIVLREARFPHPSPPHAHFYETLFPCKVVFDSSDCEILFSRKYCGRPIVRSQTELDEWLRVSPEGIMYLPGKNHSAQSFIRGELMRGLRSTHRFPSFERICSSMRMSPQVVRRRLADEGVSYQELKNIVRSDLARELLANPDLVIADIADRVGFSEPAALTRAFKGWFGQTPAQYRSELLSKVNES